MFQRLLSYMRATLRLTLIASLLAGVGGAINYSWAAFSKNNPGAVSSPHGKARPANKPRHTSEKDTPTSVGTAAAGNDFQNYTLINERNIFSPDSKTAAAKPAVERRPEKPKPRTTIAVTGTLLTPGKAAVFLQSSEGRYNGIFQLNQHLNAYTIAEIGLKEIVLVAGKTEAPKPQAEGPNEGTGEGRVTTSTAPQRLVLAIGSMAECDETGEWHLSTLAYTPPPTPTSPDPRYSLASYDRNRGGSDLGRDRSRDDRGGDRGRDRGGDGRGRDRGGEDRGGGDRGWDGGGGRGGDRGRDFGGGGGPRDDFRRPPPAQSMDLPGIAGGGAPDYRSPGGPPQAMPPEPPMFPEPVEMFVPDFPPEG